MLVVNGRQIPFGSELVTPQQDPVGSVERVDDKLDFVVVASIVSSERGSGELCAPAVDRPYTHLRSEEYLVLPHNG